jgi:hypothetical protein
VSRDFVVKRGRFQESSGLIIGSAWQNAEGRAISQKLSLVLNFHGGLH